MSHMANRIKELFKQWVELDLPKTCTSLDTFTSVSVEKNDTVVVVTKHSKGNHMGIGKYDMEEDKFHFDETLGTAILSLVIYGLEKALETN